MRIKLNAWILIIFTLIYFIRIKLNALILNCASTVSTVKFSILLLFYFMF